MSQPAADTPDQSLDEVQTALNGTLVKFLAQEQQLLEAQIEIMSNLTDISREETRSQWVRVAGGLTSSVDTIAYRNEGELKTLRDNSRELALLNPFAINIIENGKNYIFGTGHNYKVVAREGVTVSDEEMDLIKNELESFYTEYGPEYQQVNRWWLRQMETWERRERDGEVFRRKFIRDGRLYIRFIEPEHIVTPANEQTPLNNTQGTVAYGIRFQTVENGEPDLETPTEYLVQRISNPFLSQGTPATDPLRIPASDVQHIKANVDSTAPRGIPTLYAIDANLRRAVRILRNMSTVTEMQSAIAWVRKHIAATQETVQRVVSASADVSMTSSSTGKVRNYKEYAPGSILDVPSSVDYQPWAIQADVAKILFALQAELRTAAARVQYPEFMISSDASNANYSSTLVAESPSSKKFERMQFEMIAYDLDILYTALSVAAAAGRIPADTLDRIRLEAEPPSVKTRDTLKEAQSDQILVEGRAMSRKTWASRHDLDYDKEREQIETESRESAALNSELSPTSDPVTGKPLPQPKDPSLSASGGNPGLRESEQDLLEMSLNQPRVPAGNPHGGEFASPGYARFKTDFDQAFQKIASGLQLTSRGSGPSVMASLHDLRAHLPQYTQNEFNTYLRILREHDHYRADSADGQMPPGVREAGVQEGSSLLVWITKPWVKP